MGPGKPPGFVYVLQLGGQFIALRIQDGLYARIGDKRPAGREQAERYREQYRETAKTAHYISTSEREPGDEGPAATLETLGAGRRRGRTIVNASHRQVRVDDAES